MAAMRLSATLLLGLGLCAGSAQAAPSAPISKLEARTLPPELVKRRVVDQIGDLLLPEPRQTPFVRPRRPLTEMELHTRPHATWIAGLCESDAVRVEFGTAGRAADPAETPMKAVGLTAQAGFRFLQRPATRPSIEDVRAERTAADRRCAALDPDRQRFFEAQNAAVAADAAWLYLKVVEGLGQPRPPFRLECAEGWDCAKDIVADNGLDRLSGAERCDGEPLRNIGCWTVIIDAGMTWPVSIYASNGPSAQIERVVVGDPYATASDLID